MSDKSPRQSLSKKADKNLKQKRADKKAAADDRPTPSIIPPRKAK